MLHRHANTVVERDAGQQIPLGVLRDHEWTNAHFIVEPGDLLVLYTDGIIEARNPAGVAFGIERLRGLVAEGPDAPDALLAALRAAVFEYQDSRIGHDDQTLIVLRITV